MQMRFNNNNIFEEDARLDAGRRQVYDCLKVCELRATQQQQQRQQQHADHLRTHSVHLRVKTHPASGNNPHSGPEPGMATSQNLAPFTRVKMKLMNSAEQQRSGPHRTGLRADV